MCGITGFISSAHIDSEDINVIKKMADRISSRGPDSCGYWTDAVVALGHRRLSILDLSDHGAQPMHSLSKRYTLIFNGEIYNNSDLRAELDVNHILWRGHSDTETLLAGFDLWGVKNTVQKCIGMFAFAVWDNFNRNLILCRDRIGEKPLYYGWQKGDRGDAFLFGSELKALTVHPFFSASISRNSLCLLMRHNCIPAPYSIYHGIFKLEPGSLLTVSLEHQEPKIESYWSSANSVIAAMDEPFSGSPEQAIIELEEVLTSAVRRQMTADVPVGAFLSGGIDSSTIVAMMQKLSVNPVKTFTLGFDVEGYNEAIHAKAIAKHLGTDHTELYVSPRQALEVIPHLASLYCEPFSDSSQIPTYLVSKLARQQVTVSLSGDGGDELFCGYNRYVLTQKLWRSLSVLPVGVRHLASRGLTALSPKGWNVLMAMLQGFLPNALQLASPGDKLHKAAGVLTAKSVDELYLGLVSQWADPASVVIGGREPPTLLTSHSIELDCLDEIQKMMVLDVLTYLPDDILVKLDRASMGVSLESRVPFLDHRLMEFAWSLPQNLKLREGTSKWVLRQVLYRHVPKEFIDRPKMGFGVPIGDWLRGPLLEWAEELLDESRLLREGYFHPKPIRQKWTEHLSGKRNWQHHLWTVLMFQAWLEETQSA